MKLKSISTVTIISTGAHFLGNHHQFALKIGQNHQITYHVILEMHIHIINQLAMPSVLIKLFKEQKRKIFS